MSSYRKKLIEVALPLEAINIAAAREKGNPFLKGHPRNLHQWWARRPLVACRAVLFSSLVDDPDSDPAYAKYDAETREHMAGEKRQQLFDLITELIQWENSNDELIINAARAEIARCVASRKIELGELKKDKKLPGGETVYDLVVKGHGDLPKLREGKARLPNPESVNAFLAEYAPPVLDPFAGGGSIPLEAQRLGLRAYASDLNPVAVIINKALIEIPVKFSNLSPVNPEGRDEAGPAGKKGKSRGKSVLGQSEWRGAEGLADDVRYYGKWLRDEAEKRIGHLYPQIKITAKMAKDRPDLKPYVGEELKVLAWLWARTVASPNPAIGGAHVPLVRSFWLSAKKGKERWIQPLIDKKTNTYRFEVRVGEPENRASVSAGTKTGRGCKFKCLLSDQPMPDSHVKQSGQRYELNTRLLAVVAEGARGRVYLSPDEEQEKIARVAAPAKITSIEAPLANDPRNLWCLGYGLDTFDKLFTTRQLTALVTFSDMIREVISKVQTDAEASGHPLPVDARPLHKGGNGTLAYAEAIGTYLAFVLDKACDYANAICTWNPTNENVGHLFSKQAIPMAWDFAEANLLESGLAFDQIAIGIAKSIELLPAIGIGRADQLDAAAAIAVSEQFVPSTDPPYYDNIAYSDLSDFFYVWLRRSLSTIYPNLTSTVVTPKKQELIASPYRHEGDSNAAMEFFEHGFSAAFTAIRKHQSNDVPLTVFYAFKQAEEDAADDDDHHSLPVSLASTGWETMLEALIRAGFVIDGTWPIRTERAARSVGLGTNSLASSVVLSCRPRPTEAPLATRREFLNSLKHELPTSLRHLQRGSIAPVDLAQAAIGPGMAVFTRYAKVVEADGSPMKVRQALSLINQTLDEVLAEQEGEFDSDTRWAVAWFEQFGVDEGTFGMAETLSKAKNTAVNALVDAGIIVARGGKVRLLKRDELPANWNPATDNKVRHWEVAQHLIRALETGGETAAADLLRKVGGMGEVARDLAYRLYNLCERKKWASEALSYNGLVIAWPEINKLAQLSAPVAVKPDARLF